MEELEPCRIMREAHDGSACLPRTKVDVAFGSKVESSTALYLISDRNATQSFVHQAYCIDGLWMGCQL